MDKIKLHCIDNGKTLDADVISRSSMQLKVSPHSTTMVVILNKKTPNDRLYIGRVGSLEFQTKG